MKNADMTLDFIKTTPQEFGNPTEYFYVIISSLIRTDTDQSVITVGYGIAPYHAARLADYT
ncbi:MAG: hypothetical protein IJ639_05955, partial [Ruminococcus sp.]|nr:hypothetical protein [Ruminococcus sp.]